MNTHFESPQFDVPKDVSLPQNVEDLESNYYLKKIESTSHGVTWKLQKKMMPGAIRNIFSSFERTSHHEVKSEKLRSITAIAGNPTHKHQQPADIEIFTHSELEALSRNPHFQSFAREIPGMEKPETKLKRGLSKLANIGKGLAQMKEHQMKGCMLSSDYWFEAVTKEHFYDPKFMDEWEGSDTHLNFDDWMAKTHSNVTSGKVKYLNNEQERAPYKLDFREGKEWRNDAVFSTANERTEHSGQGRAIFVIDSNNQIYSASHLRGKFQHSSFLAGSAVLGAGEIQTDGEGRIVELSSKSGHYKPSREQILNTLKCLEDKGVDLSHVRLSEVTDEGSWVYHSAKVYLDNLGICFCDGYENLNIEFDYERECTLSCHYQNLSKNEILAQLEKFSSLLEFKFEITPVIYKEELRSGQHAEYSLEAFIEKKGKILPTKWDGGTLEFQDDTLTQVTLSSPNVITDHNNLSFFKLLEIRGVDLSTVEIQFSDGMVLNGQVYYEQLIDAYRQKEASNIH